VAVVINNLGGLSILELNIIADEVIGQLQKIGLDIRRMLVGPFVTSLGGPGFSVTVLNLQPEFEELLNAKTITPASPNQAEPSGRVSGLVERITEPKEEKHGEQAGEIILPGLYKLCSISCSPETFH
jgi:triose/dihydroxyacetone kinase / FAD-AMP lyase (cyclizing)